ncbi:MAG: HipA domain-containing protein [Desulfobacteraceae bacterium]|nr:HipA domain-containing protein [Desulfobacteraceae bacterium]
MKADGYYNISYREMAEVIKHVSASPQQDLHMLYRQMVFNVMIMNTDDHLKNFCMLHDDQGWRLSPAFDLTPDIGDTQEHVLRIGLNNRPSDIEIIFAEAKYFGIKRRQSTINVVQNIYSAVSEWPQIFSDHDVPEKDTEIIGNEIKGNLARLFPLISC